MARYKGRASRHNNNTTNDSNNDTIVVDPKLAHLVRKIVTNGGANASTITAERVTEVLVDRNREYRRRNSVALRKSVGTVLAIMINENDNSSANNNTNGKRKRNNVRIPVGGQNKEDGGDKDNFEKKDVEDDKINGNDDDSYDVQARENDHRLDTLIASPPFGGTNNLNAGLSDRYGDLQRERDLERRKKEKAAEKAEAIAAAEKEAEVAAAVEAEAAEAEAAEAKLEGWEEKGYGSDCDSVDNANEISLDKDTSHRLNHPVTMKMKAMTQQLSPPQNQPISGKRKKRIKRKKIRDGDGGGDQVEEGTQQQPSFVVPVERPKERFADLGGVDCIVDEVRRLIEYPLNHPELFVHLGIDPPRGVLLRGPPGCGKSHLANAIAGELGVPYFRLSSTEIVGGVSGESERRLRELFDSASKHAPSIVFLDEIDAIAPKRGDDGGGKSMEKRIVAQFLTCLDSLAPCNNRNNAPVIILGATNRPDSIDPALRRAGRFDREITMAVPDENARYGILQSMTSKMRLLKDQKSEHDGDCNEKNKGINYKVGENVVDLRVLAKKTPGFVGADMRSLTREAAVVAIDRILNLVPSYCSIPSFPTPVAVEEKKVESKEESRSIEREVEQAGDKEGVKDLKDGTSADTSDSIDCEISSTEEKVYASVNSSMNNDDGKSNTSIDNSAIFSPPTSTVSTSSTVPFTSQQLAPLYVTMADFLAAVPLVQPSAKREGFATVPDVSWEEIGALRSVREELTLSVLEPIMHPERFKMLGIPVPSGVLLFGPPGCGKTLLAKAIANESGANFLSVKGPELLDKYVGESERAVRTVFERARSSSPCIVFFDELDSLCPKRGSGGGGGGGVSERVVNQLLTEMDGLDARRSVFVIAATNRPELIDPAMMRPGRLDKLLYVPLPSPIDRAAILKALAVKIKLDAGVDLNEIAHSPRAEGYSGADCAALLREAGLAVLRDSILSRKDNLRSVGILTEAPTLKLNEEDTKKEIDTKTVSHESGIITSSISSSFPLRICQMHFDYAFDHVLPSVSEKDKIKYDKLRDRMGKSRKRSNISETDDKSEKKNFIDAII